MRLMSIPFLLCCCAHIMSVGYLHSLIDFVLWKVHITQGNHDGTAMIISWVTTIEPGSSTVVYGTSEDNLNYTANGKHTQYTFYNYTSGYIHHCTIKKLEVTNSSNFWTDVCLFLTYMETPILIFVAVWHKVLLCCWNWTNGEEILVHDPSKKRPRCSIYIWSYRYIPIFRGYSLIDLFTKQSVHISSSLLSALNSSISEWLMSLNLLQIYAGDLGQSFDSNVTLAHYESNSKAQAVLFAGDLSYADNYPYHDNVRWDTWARFVERNVAYQPWIWTAGNHEIDFAPELVSSSLFTGLILD